MIVYLNKIQLFVCLVFIHCNLLFHVLLFFFLLFFFLFCFFLWVTHTHTKVTDQGQLSPNQYFKQLVISWIVILGIYTSVDFACTSFHIIWPIWPADSSLVPKYNPIRCIEWPRWNWTKFKVLGQCQILKNCSKIKERAI